MAYLNPIPDMDDRPAGKKKERKPVSAEPVPEESASTESSSDYASMMEIYFAFIDVLGFKKTFDDMKISQNKDAADKYKDVFNYYFALIDAANFMRGGESTGCYAGQTSDSLYFYTDRPDYLFQFIKIFSHFNLYAMSRDVFFRGGIAKGSLYKKEKYQFYGDSVIGAYLLESKIAKNPIITIDERTHADMTDVEGYLDFVKSKQERHYIKPFASLEQKSILDVDDSFELKKIERRDVEENILKNKKIFEYDESNYGKYVFLLNELKEIE